MENKFCWHDYETFGVNTTVYLIVIGGGAYFLSKAINHAKVVAFPELGMKAIMGLN